jgi:WD40 repeat protein
MQFSTKPAEPAPAVSSSPPRYVLALYFVLFVILLYQLSSVTKVHSRFGLAFTGIVQLCCSTVMSFSVLALLGWNGWGWGTGETVLPTYTLPFVIVVVGVENMSALVSVLVRTATNSQTKAVFSVPFTYSVPVRIGIGLGKVGSEIALTSLTDLALLGLVWLCVHLQAVREFCIFAAVVIVTDWFMLHTFFLTVLSIDAQRLELADVIASNGSMTSAELQKQEEDKEKRRAARRAKRFSWHNVLRARTAKSGSLLLLLTSLVVLYYYTEPGRTKFRTPAELYGYKPSSTTSAAPSAMPSFTTTAVDLSSLSISESFWRSLNPQGLGSVRISQPPSTIVVLPRVGHSLLPADLRKLSLPTKTFKLPRLEPLWYWVKMGLLPQVATAFALYGLLLYLLKDTDLLDAQRNRLGRGREPNASDDDSDDNSSSKATKGCTAGAGIHMLPASHESDVDIIASSGDGRLAISVGIDNSICLWRFSDEEHVAGTREMLPTTFIPPGDPIVAAAVSNDRQFAAVVTRAGLVQFWSTPEDDRKTEPLGPVQVTGRAVALAFDESATGFEDPFAASPTARTAPPRPSILVAMSDGAIHAITPGKGVVTVAPAATADNNVVCRVDLLTTKTGPVAVVSGSTRITMWRKEFGEWAASDLMSACDSTDRVSAVATGILDLPRSTQVVAIGRRSGRVEVFDSDGEPMSAEFGQVSDAVRSLAISVPPTTRCSTCDSRSTDGFYVVSSTADHVYIDRILPRFADAFCRCPPRRTAVMDDGRAGAAIVLPPSSARARTVSGGFNRSTTTSPIKGGTLAPPSNGDFPLSSHGVRRLSGWRADPDPPRPPSPLDRSASLTALSALCMSSPDEITSPARASNLADVLPLGAVVAADGGWAILDHHLIGVRRAGTGIDDSQWHLWAVDLAAPWNGSSLLVDSSGLDVLERRTRATAPRTDSLAPGETPMRARRAERMLSLHGRASFPSATGSFSVPTHAPLGYVAVRPFRTAGRRTLLAGFGNRVGVLSLPPHKASMLPPAPRAAPLASPVPRATPRRAPPPPRREPNGDSHAGAGVNANNNVNGNGVTYTSATNGGLSPYTSPPKH